jgi:3-hydroxyacyl-CoA dehydrogenase
MNDEIRTVGVVGLGVMGFDIAFLYAMKGFETHVYDASKATMESLRDRCEQTIERLARRNRITAEETARVRNLLLPSPDLAGLARTDLVTEAVSENAKTKLTVYQGLREAGFAGILTTNTSSVTRATLLADGAYDREKFALTHFFNPVLYTQMVEVVKGDMGNTNSGVVLSFLKRLGRDPVETQDISGFVSNGILMVYAVMACRLLECGARIEEVDGAAKELRLLPPFTSFDSWKPSIVEDVTRVMFDLRGDAFLRSSKLLTRLAKDNPRFYLEQNPNLEIYDLAAARGGTLGAATIKRALKTSILIAAARVAELGESPVTVDFVATEGVKIPQAPLQEIDGIGAAAVLEELEKLNRDLPENPLTAPGLLMTMATERETFYRNGQANSWLSARAQS